ncbi:hypothetical protein Y032_0990g3312 [Ancylostoma ceylanicum]|uniref:Uncharacterized protein n=1 Tax=Ancylostoma ceylanicum TaxID=53326 RepID=A0A016W7C8_9BILA|nr:hypothetical protein Y032_0990g3312 [Ancylostoma ceylanicum]
MSTIQFYALILALSVGIANTGMFTLIFSLKNWNCGLEAAAHQHAMTCTFAKSDVSTRPDNGENQATIATAASYQAAAEEV